MFMTYHAKMLAQYGVGVDKQVKAVTGINGCLLLRTAVLAEKA